MKVYFCGFVIWQRVAFAMAVVPLAIGGGVFALFVRGMHAEWGAELGFCLVSALAIVQECIVANGIAEARRLNSNVRNAWQLRRNFEMSSSLGYVRS
jgi:Cu/Ag efflux pump CusA